MPDYTPNPPNIYTQVTDDLEIRVLEALIENADRRVSRQELARRVFGAHLDRDKLLYSREDRRIRAAIASLQGRGFPITANSRQAGYVLTTNADEINAAIADLQSRQNHIDAKIAGLRRALQKLPAIKAAQQEHAEQLSLFHTIRRGPGGEVWGG